MPNYNSELLNSLSDKEREYALSILKQMSDGDSKKWNELLYEDYEEIPVSVEEFIHNREYLGTALTDENGRFTLFPYWEETLKKIFPTNIDTAYNTAILTGGIGLGKSTEAVIIILYQLYRMMCLKNPYTHYGLQEIDLITFAFINITLDAAKGVAWDKCQQMLQKSPWFMARGTMTKSLSPQWKPPKGIELIYGSMPRHIIGRAVYGIFCLAGDTIVSTEFGDKKIEDLVGKSFRVNSVNENGDVIMSDVCTAECTKETNVKIRIELENGKFVECTPEHRFMLKDGTYKEAQQLTEEDELWDMCESDSSITYKEYIDNIINTRGQWNIPDGEYFECHHILPRCMGGTGDIRKRSKSYKHENIIYLYANEHYTAHKLLALENPDNRKLVSAWEMMSHPKGKTKRENSYITEDDYECMKKLWSKHMSENNPGKLENGHPWNYGTHMTEEQKKRLSESKTGKKIKCHSAESKLRHSAAVRKRYLEHPETFVSKKGSFCITDGESIRFIYNKEEIPDGWYLGNCRTSGKHDMSNYYSSEEMQERKRFNSTGKNNPNYGKGEKQSGGNNGHATIRYFFEGNTYECRKDLIAYLKPNFPNISEHAIRSIVNGDYGNTIKKKFSYIIDNLTWESKL